jgi:site-specific DNA-methyltransferase (adenine-specific)
MTMEDWQTLLRQVIVLHYSILKPGAFLAINIADILSYSDPSMPRIQASNPDKWGYSITQKDILDAIKKHGTSNRHKLAKLLGCSEQTIDRRLHGNNIRGGKQKTQTKVKLVGGMIEEYASDAGLYLYDRRVWIKDPAWENCEWHSLSFRSVVEFEYIYIFWKPGPTKVDRRRLTGEEWSAWGSRGVWRIPSVRTNDIHEAMFPVELPTRLIKLMTEKGDLVLDCFIGSGTTAVAAIRLGRHYIGIDIMENYVKLAKSLCATEKRRVNGSMTLLQYSS